MSAILIGVGVVVAAVIGYFVMNPSALDSVKSIYPIDMTQSFVQEPAAVQNVSSPIISQSQTSQLKDSELLIDDAFVIAADGERSIKFQTEPASSSYLVGTVSVTGDSLIMMEIRNSENECSSFGCSTAAVEGDNSMMFRPHNGDIKMKIFSGSEQYLVIENRSDDPVTVTMDLTIEYTRIQSETVE